MKLSSQETLNYILTSSDFVEIKESTEIAIDLKYAGNDNILKQDVYKNFNRAFLHQVAAKKLSAAAGNLKKLKPNYKLIIFDALRPRSIQHTFWNKVKNTAQEKYFANPEVGSNHNYGMAVDISILNEKNIELDMGTGFDALEALSEPQLEQDFFQLKKITSEQLQNRLLLRSVMEQAGFTQLPTEWWHFDALSRSEIQKNFKIVE